MWSSKPCKCSIVALALSLLSVLVLANGDGTSLSLAMGRTEVTTASATATIILRDDEYDESSSSRKVLWYHTAMATTRDYLQCISVACSLFDYLISHTSET